MSDTLATPDAPAAPMAVQTTQITTVRYGARSYTIPAGQIVALVVLPAITSYRLKANERLIPAATYAIGDIAPLT